MNKKKFKYYIVTDTWYGENFYYFFIDQKTAEKAQEMLDSENEVEIEIPISKERNQQLINAVLNTLHDLKGHGQIKRKDGKEIFEEIHEDKYLKKVEAFKLKTLIF